MTRRLTAAVLFLLVASPLRAADKEVQRLAVLVQTLQIQLSDLQRATQENQRELRRLNESLAEQTSLFRQALQDQRVHGEALQSSMKETTDRLAEVGEALRALQASTQPFLPPPGPGASPSPGEPGAEGGTAGPAPAASPAPPPRELYSQAYADFARGNYDLAIQGFQEYLKYYPDTDFSDNAQYWIGECLYGKQQYSEAIEAWNTLLRDYASSDKLPDARVKKGMALERLGRRSQALLEYRYVVERYPNAPAARIAREKLNPR